MIAAELVVAAPIRRTKVEALEAITVDAERDPHEAAGRFGRAGGGEPGQLDLDRAVLEARALEDGERGLVVGGQLRQSHRRTSTICHGLGVRAVGLEVARRWQQ